MLVRENDGSHLKTLIRDSHISEAILDHYLNNLLTGWVQKNKAPLFSNDLLEIFPHDALRQKDAKIKTAISLPLEKADKIIGVLNIISERDRLQIYEDDQQLLQLLAVQCSHAIVNANLHKKLFDESQKLRQLIKDRYTRAGLIGESEAMQKVFALMDRVIPLDVRVLIEGESGTGKEQITRAIHYNGPRANKPFLAVDCGALPANLLESELFGYTKGAFTGAAADRQGLFRQADGGTLFLDEIANMPIDLQAKLLRVLNENEVRPIGSDHSVAVDVRIIAATSADLITEIRAGNFRKDLYYRLNIINIKLPPLRDRREDIILLAGKVLSDLADKYEKKTLRFEPGVITLFERYPWPGNVRELEHTIERAVVLAGSEQLTSGDFAFLEEKPDPEYMDLLPTALKEAIHVFKKEFVMKMLRRTSGNQAAAAKLMGIQRTYLNRLIKELAISPEKI